MSVADYSTLSVADLMERFETVVADLTAIRKALKKAAKVKRSPKVGEDGEPVKRVASVWAAWSAHAKTTYAAEYEAFVAAEAAKGKKQGLVPVFAKQAKEVHADDYATFATHYEAEHPKSSASSVASSKKSKAAAAKAVAAAALETTDDEATSAKGSTKSRGRKPAASTGGAGAGAGVTAVAPSASDAEKPKKAGRKAGAGAGAAAATTDSEAEAPKPKAKREAKVPKKASE